MPPARRTAAAFFWGLFPLAAVLGASALPLLHTLSAPWGLRPAAVTLERARANAPWLLALLFALGWAALSAFWSLTPDAPLRALKHLGVSGVALAFLASSTADEKTRAAVSRWAALAALGLAALCAVEAAAGMPLNRLLQPGETDMVKLARNPAKGVALLLLLLFPALLGLARKGNGPLAVGLALTAAGVSFQFGQAANAAALLAGGLAAGFCLLAPRLGLWLCGVVWAGWLLLAPWVSAPMRPMMQEMPTSWEMRGAIWSYAVDRIREKPWFGWGFEASRNFPGNQSIDGVVIPNISLHTHSASIQAWLELGAVGVLLGAAAMLLVARGAVRALRQDRGRVAAAAGTAGVLFVLWNLSFGLWQEWLWAAAAASAAAALGAPAEGARQRSVLVME